MKKVKTAWSSCPSCGVVVSNRYLKRHEKDHDSEEKLDPSQNSTKTSGHSGRNFIQSQLFGRTTEHEYGFFLDGVLHAVVSRSKLDADVKPPKAIEDRIALLSPGTMRVANIAIGDHIAINDKYAYKAWPHTSTPDCHVQIPADNRMCQGGDILNNGSLCRVNSLPSPLPAAQNVSVKAEHGKSPLSTSVLGEESLNFIKSQLVGRPVSAGAFLTVCYFGKPLHVQIEIVVGSENSQPMDDSLLSQQMEDLHLPGPAGDVDSSPSTPNRSSLGDRASICSTPSSHHEHRILPSRGRFYLVGQSTVVNLGVERVETSDTSICDSDNQVPALAGVDDVMESLRQLIVEPISKLDVYKKYGVQVAKGALLYGPSGCGKTLIAKSIGQTLKGRASFITLDTTELWSKQFGETENRLQKIFQQAIDNSPSVLFIDDIDVMCPRRERSQSDLEKRVLSALVSEIDRIGECRDSYVFLLATTCRLDAVDMSLRRPGRFDRELEVSVPSSSQREKIISALLRPMLHSVSETDIRDIASDCHGYVGADLQSLCREAGLHAMRSEREEGMTMEDLRQAMSTVQPSAMREIYVDVPKVRWTDIAGEQHLKQTLIQSIVWPLQHSQQFTRLGITPPRGVLMYGPPGCSKTMIAKALATETSLNFISIKGPELFSKWVGESEKAVREVFRKARNAAPSIIFFDEIDAIAVERGRQQSSGGGVGDRVLAQLLTELDGVQGLTGVNIVAATNRPDMIDKALMRPGRLDRLVYVPLPDHSTREQIFRLRLKPVPLSEDVSYDELVSKTSMYSGAEVVAVCNEAALMAMQESLEAELITRRHLLSAIDSVKPQTTKSMVQYYLDYASGGKG